MLVRFLHRVVCRRVILGAAVGLFVFSSLLLTGATTGPALRTDAIDQLISNNSTGTAIWGVYVQDITSGQVLYEHNGNKGFLPASTLKLLTTATALSALGGDYRYRTILYFIGEINGSTLKGDLIIRGSGDPTFGSVQIGGPDPLRTWARNLKDMGVTRIEGRIIGDDDVFDDVPYADGWDIDYLTSQSSRELGIAASGLSYRDNVIEVTVRSSNVGSAPEISMIPEGYLKIDNDATTAGRKRGWATRLFREIGSEQIILSGSVPRSFRGGLAIPVANPTAYTVYSFNHFLKEAGIDTRAELLDVDSVEEEPDLKDAQPLFVYISPPLSRIIAILNKESNNFYAEQVFRTYGWGGSGPGGEQRVKDLMARASASTFGFSMQDGSGLSRKDIVSPEVMVKVLAHMYNSPHRDDYLTSLASGGERRSTLAGRLFDTPVHAKTGSLEHVRSLAGYATGADGRTLAFAVFANNFTTSSYQVTHTIDEIIREVTASGQP